jgi:hypothetical protein
MEISVQEARAQAQLLLGAAGDELPTKAHRCDTAVNNDKWASSEVGTLSRLRRTQTT